MPGAYRGPSGDFQGINQEIFNLVIRLYFGSNSASITILLLYFTGETNIPKSLGMSMGSSCQTSLGQNDRMFKRCLGDIAQTVFLNSTFKNIEHTLTG